MKIIPAIDLIGGKVVRLQKGDYGKVTVYGDDPVAVAREFYAAGAEYLHVVDLDGAKSGGTDNFDVIATIAKETPLKVEVGGGIRSIETVAKYVSAGVYRVIIGTAAVTDPAFLAEAVKEFGEAVAVGVDIKDGLVAIRGWTEVSSVTLRELCTRLQHIGVRTVICTDISKDGMMAGTNLELYRLLSQEFSLDIVASGGVSTLDDVKALFDMKIYGAIVGRALYTGDINLADAIAITKRTE